MPAVTVCSSPIGDPITTTGSSAAGVRPSSSGSRYRSTYSSARSFFGSQDQKYWHNDFGNLYCVTADTVTAPAGMCNATGSTADAKVHKVYRYDYLDRMESVRKYSAGSLTDEASYTYDPFNGLVRETENYVKASVRRTPLRTRASRRC